MSYDRSEFNANDNKYNFLESTKFRDCYISKNSSNRTPGTKLQKNLDSKNLNENLTLSFKNKNLNEILQNISLLKYLDIFEDQEIDVKSFIELSEDDLNDIGITISQDKNIILAAIKSIKEKVIY